YREVEAEYQTEASGSFSGREVRRTCERVRREIPFNGDQPWQTQDSSGTAGVSHIRDRSGSASESGDGSKDRVAGGEHPAEYADYQKAGLSKEEFVLGFQRSVREVSAVGGLAAAARRKMIRLRRTAGWNK